MNLLTHPKLASSGRMVVGAKIGVNRISPGQNSFASLCKYHCITISRWHFSSFLEQHVTQNCVVSKYQWKEVIRFIKS